jgi:hypothetical protein
LCIPGQENIILYRKDDIRKHPYRFFPLGGKVAGPVDGVCGSPLDEGLLPVEEDKLEADIRSLRKDFNQSECGVEPAMCTGLLLHHNQNVPKKSRLHKNSKILFWNKMVRFFSVFAFKNQLVYFII